MTRLVTPVRTIESNTFAERYRPLPNHLDHTAACDFGSGGCLFAPTTKQFRHVLAQSPRKIWTVVDHDDGTILIESGLALANRCGYLVTEKPAADDGRYLLILEKGAVTPSLRDTRDELVGAHAA